MSKSPITCHVLDSSSGKPAAGVAVSVHQLLVNNTMPTPDFHELATGRTNNDGRCTDLLAPGKLQSGIYKVTFMTGEWMKQNGTACFYPQVDITFELTNSDEHYHIPLLLSPYGYTTYRGS